MSGPSPAPRVLRVPALDAGIARRLQALSWPRERLAEGLEALSLAAGLPAAGRAERQWPQPPRAGDEAVLAPWVDAVASGLGLEAELVEAAVPEVGAMLRTVGPLVLVWHDAGHERFLLLLRVRGRTAWLLAADARLARCPLHELRTALCWSIQAPLVPELEWLLRQSGVAAARQPRARQAMLDERLAHQPGASGWVLRLPASAPFSRQLAHARVPALLALVAMAFAALYAAELVGWTLIGHGVLDGRLDTGWLVAWALLLVTMVPLQVGGAALQATMALRVSRLLKSRLLAGALRMDLDTVRGQGVGGLLGRVIESQALESLAVNGGLAVGVAVLELCFAAGVLALGAAGGWHLGLLVGWVLLSLVLAARYVRRQRRWTKARLTLTHELVEQMVGHRTRLAQERAVRRDARDDGLLQSYLGTAAAMDRAAVPVLAGLPSGWLLASVALLGPVFAAGGAAVTPLAISLGGVLLAQRALGSLVGGLGSLARAAVAWHEVAPLFKAGARDTDAAVFVPLDAGVGAGAPPAGPLVDAHGLRFQHADGRRVLDGVDLRLMRGERVLLQGPSGSGKSTLAALLTGLRQPQAGLLLLHGLDRATLGDQWSLRAASAPQFHENHVLSGTFAFNLLLGRTWPARPDELRAAEMLCEELGLGPLLARMPAGMAQRIGETGWQLSHGERSRLFLARALLQRAPLVVMDESFAALDPPTLARCLAAAQRHADTLVVIAHP